MFLAVTRLGLIACQYLAKCYAEGRYVAAPDIAERYNMNVRALMPALRQLTKAGILRSRVGGLEPGFIFSRDPEELTALDIVLALEGDREFLCSMDSISGVKCSCNSKEECVLYETFNSMINYAKYKLSTISIKNYSKSSINSNLKK